MLQCITNEEAVLASFPVLPTPAFISQPWKIKIKAGVGRTGRLLVSGSPPPASPHDT